ncbi:MAG: ATP-binding protein, partial [Bacteroidota bacterium]
YQVRKKEQELEMRANIERAKVDERERVRKNTAADFHDDLGNKMTKISLFVELAKRNAAEKDQLFRYLDQVGDQTRNLSEGMRDFLWVLDPEKDTLSDTLGRLADFGEQLFDLTDTAFYLHGLHADLEKIILPLNQRRHLVLILKEGMHNVVKYAAASRVDLLVKIDDERAELQLIDNGKGFDLSAESQGYGLKNMKARAEKMGGELEIFSEFHQGTKLYLRFDLPHMGD